MFDNTPNMAQFSTMSHEYFFSNNISLSQLFNSGGIDLALPHSHPFQIQANESIYLALLENATSLGTLLARTVHQCISPLIWLEKARLTLQKKTIPVFCLKTKFQMACTFWS